MLDAISGRTSTTGTDSHKGENCLQALRTFLLCQGCGRGGPTAEPLYIYVPQARYNQANSLWLDWADLHRSADAQLPAILSSLPMQCSQYCP